MELTIDQQHAKQQILNLINTGQKENLELALQLGTNTKEFFNVRKYLEETYQPLISFVNLDVYHNLRIQWCKSLSEQVEYLANITDLHTYNKTLIKIPQHFNLLSNLRKFFCYSNLLHEIDLSENFNLEQIAIYNNPKLKELKVPKNGNLTEGSISKDPQCKIIWV